MTDYLPAKPPSLTGNRVESWWVDLLTRDDVTVATLDGVDDCVIEQNVFATISGGGEMLIDDLGQNIDWLNARIQPWFRVHGYGEWPLGVFLTSAPRATHNGSGRSWRVELLDKTSILDGDQVDATYSLPAGTTVTTAVREMIESTGEAAIAITDSIEALSTGMTWPAGTSKLQVVNELLASINYFSVRCDGFGQFVAEPYVRPQDRAPAWHFQASETAIHSADFIRDQDLASIPNKVVLISASSYDQEAMTSVATNTDPDSPYSHQARGRWIVHTEEMVEATSQQVLDELAARKLENLSSVAATLEVSWAPMPRSINETVTFNTGEVDALGVIQKMRQRLAVGEDMYGTIREVATR